MICLTESIVGEREECEAFAFGYKAHEGALHRDGKPAFQHSIRVSRCFIEKHLRAIAYLHDVMEDCDVQVQDLTRAGFSARVIFGVIDLTRDPDETWEHYMARVMNNRDAVLVKIADIEDNIARCTKTDKMYPKLPMYRKTLKELKEIANT